MRRRFGKRKGAAAATEASSGDPIQKNKYNANKPTAYGRTWDSDAELRRYEELLLAEEMGMVGGIEVQPQFHIIVNGVHIYSYKADFRYTNLVDHQVVVEDVKNPVTSRERDFVRTRKLIKALYRIDIVVIGGEKKGKKDE